ncbi:MAG: hypothetical protein RJQ14_01725, partial [Marinoscillum sp.]
QPVGINNGGGTNDYGDTQHDPFKIGALRIKAEGRFFFVVVHCQKRGFTSASKLRILIKLETKNCQLGILPVIGFFDKSVSVVSSVKRTELSYTFDLLNSEKVPSSISIKQYPMD